MLDEAQPDGLRDVGGLGAEQAASPDHRPHQPRELLDQAVPGVAVPAGRGQDELPRLLGLEHLPMVEDHLRAVPYLAPCPGLVVVVRPAPWDVESTKGPVLDMDWDGRELRPGARGHMATFARTLARPASPTAVQVVLSPATPWPRQAISIGDPAPLASTWSSSWWPATAWSCRPGGCPARAPAPLPGRGMRSGCWWRPALYQGEILAIGLAAPSARAHPSRGAAGRCAPGAAAMGRHAPPPAGTRRTSAAGPAGSNSEPGRPPASPATGTAAQGRPKQANEDARGHRSRVVGLHGARPRRARRPPTGRRRRRGGARPSSRPRCRRPPGPGWPRRTSAPARCSAAASPSSSSPALTAAVPTSQAASTTSRGASMQLLEVEHGQHPVGQPEAGEHRVVDPERAVAGEVGDVRAVERGEHRIDAGAIATEDPGRGVHGRPARPARPGRPAALARRRGPRRRRSSGRAAARPSRRAGTTDDRHAVARGQRGPRQRVERAGRADDEGARGRRPPASNGASERGVERARASSSERSAAAGTGGPATAGQPAQREQRRSDEAVDAVRVGRRGRAGGGPGRRARPPRRGARRARSRRGASPHRARAGARARSDGDGSRARSDSRSSTGAAARARTRTSSSATARRAAAGSSPSAAAWSSRAVAARSAARLPGQLPVVVVAGVPRSSEAPRHWSRRRSTAHGVAAVHRDAQAQLGESGAVARGPDAQLRGAHQRLEAGDGVEPGLDGTAGRGAAAAVEPVDRLGVPRPDPLDQRPAASPGPHDVEAGRGRARRRRGAGRSAQP